MSLRSMLSIGSILGDICDNSLPVDNSTPDRLDVGVLVAEVECAGPNSKLDGEVHNSVPVGIAGGVLLDADAEILDETELVEESEGGVEVIVDVEGVLRVRDKKGCALECCWHRVFFLFAFGVHFSARRIL